MKGQIYVSVLQEELRVARRIAESNKRELLRHQRLLKEAHDGLKFMCKLWREK